MAKAKSRNKTNLARKQLRSSYFTSIISISLVLIMLGLMGFLVLNANRLSVYVRENLGFTIILNDGVKENKIFAFQEELNKKEYVKSSEYITKEQAAIELEKETGENFIEFLGYNPLMSSIHVLLNADFANINEISEIEKTLVKYSEVKEVFYEKNLVHLVNKNIKKIGFIVLIFGFFLLIISIALINNTIRLSIYANRFSINTLKLVGATKAFIRKPYLKQSLLHATVGSFLAISVLSSAIYFVKNELESIIKIENNYLLFLFVYLLGILITCVSTYFAVNRYLHRETSGL